MYYNNYCYLFYTIINIIVIIIIIQIFLSFILLFRRYCAVHAPHRLICVADLDRNSDRPIYLSPSMTTTTTTNTPSGTNSRDARSAAVLIIFYPRLVRSAKPFDSSVFSFGLSTLEVRRFVSLSIGRRLRRVGWREYKYTRKKGRYPHLLLPASGAVRKCAGELPRSITAQWPIFRLARETAIGNTAAVYWN